MYGKAFPVQPGLNCNNSVGKAAETDEKVLAGISLRCYTWNEQMFTNNCSRVTLFFVLQMVRKRRAGPLFMSGMF